MYNCDFSGSFTASWRYFFVTSCSSGGGSSPSGAALPRAGLEAEAGACAWIWLRSAVFACGCLAFLAAMLVDFAGAFAAFSG